MFSHPSKLGIIRAARARGYLTIVMHVGVESADLSVARVGACTSEGGHDVPEEKVRARYARSGPLIREAVPAADRGMVFDNSRLNVPPRQVLLFSAGQLSTASANMPSWVREIYSADLSS